MPIKPKPYSPKNMLTEKDLPTVLTSEERDHLRDDHEKEGVRITHAELEQQITAQLKTQNTVSPAPATILNLSITLEKLFHVKKANEQFNKNNYLAHAQQIVSTYRQLYIAISRYDWGSNDLKKELHKALNNIYEVLEDHGWQCGLAPQGLLIESEQSLTRFLAGLSGEETDQSAFFHPFKSATKIRKLCHNALKNDILSANDSESDEEDDISKLVTKIKRSEPLFRDEFIIGNPLIANQVNRQETHIEDLGFTPLFYTAKYHKNKGSISCILHHCGNKQELMNTLNATLRQPANPYCGARPLMISAQFGTPASCNEILEIASAEKETYVNYSITKKGEYEGWTALHFACNADWSSPEELNAQLEKVTLFLKAKANINAQSKSKPFKTPLSIALAKNNIALFRLLVQFGVSLKLENENAHYVMSLVRESILSQEEKQEICAALNISLKACQYNRPTQSGLSPSLSSKTSPPPSTKRKKSSGEFSPITLPPAPELPNLGMMPSAATPVSTPRLTDHQYMHAAAAAAAPPFVTHSAEEPTIKRAKTHPDPLSHSSFFEQAQRHALLEASNRAKQQEYLLELEALRRKLQEKEAQLEQNLLIQAQISAFQQHAEYAGRALIEARQNVTNQEAIVQNLRAQLIKEEQKLERIKTIKNAAKETYAFSLRRIQNPEQHFLKTQSNPSELFDVRIPCSCSTPSCLNKLYINAQQSTAANSRSFFAHGSQQSQAQQQQQQQPYYTPQQ